MKKIALALLVLMLVAGTAQARESIDWVEKQAATINGGKNTDGKQAEYLEKFYEIQDNKDGVWNCKDRAEFACRLLKENGYTYQVKSHEVFSGQGIWHQYVEVKVEKNWLYSFLGVNDWMPILDVWSI